MEYKILDLGLIKFDQAIEIQRELFLEVKSQNLPAGVILCQHYPVVTLGRRSSSCNILASAELLAQRGVGLYYAQRGGDVTYHGPDQLTVYPIINLRHFKKDIHWFLRRLEDLIIGSLDDFGVSAKRREMFTGAWVDGRKIASVGIAIRNWITFHGLSINIKREGIENFHLIRPCGMDIEMTSVEEVLNRKVELKLIKTSLISKFNRIFQMRPKLSERSEAKFVGRV